MIERPLSGILWRHDLTSKKPIHYSFIHRDSVCPSLRLHPSWLATIAMGVMGGKVWLKLGQP